MPPEKAFLAGSARAAIFGENLGVLSRTSSADTTVAFVVG
jgi:hypothetical protein